MFEDERVSLIDHGTELRHRLALAVSDKRHLLHQGKTGREMPDRDALVALWVQAYVEVLRPDAGAL